MTFSKQKKGKGGTFLNYLIRIILLSYGQTKNKSNIVDKWVSIFSFAELHHPGRDKQGWKENANTARLDSTSFEVSQDFSILR